MRIKAIMENTLRNGFISKAAFKTFLESRTLYARDNDFFSMSNKIYDTIMNSSYKDNKDIQSHLRIIYDGVDCINDEGWMFPTWQENERKVMIPALLALYDLVEGFDWSTC
jgi:hypothetical protein